MNYEGRIRRWLAAGRLDQWWKPKAANLLSVIYWTLLITATPLSGKTWLILPALCTIAGIGCFGHFINDLYDIGQDRAAGKANSMGGLSRPGRVGYMGGALALALLPWIVLPADRFSFLLIGLEFAALVLYAVPPFRAKDRMVWPVLLDAGYAYAIPALLAAYTFALGRGEPAFSMQPGHSSFSFHVGPPAGLPMALALCGWQLSLGIRHYLNHLAIDRANDLHASTPTLATRMGNAFIHRLIRRYVLPAEILALSLLLWLTGPEFRWPALTVPAVWLLLHALPHLFTADGYALISARFNGMALDRFYQEDWPLIPLCWLAVRDPAYGFLIALHLLVFRVALLHGIYQLLRFLFWFLALPLLASVRRALPGRRAVKRVLRGRHDDEEPPAAIVLANINKGKYTETFINELGPRLKYPIHYWYGGEIPDQYQAPGRRPRGFLPEWESLRRVLGLLEHLLQGRNYLRHRLCDYIQHHRIRLVLAEFGPVGASLYPITRETGTPLVVYFHGYDVYNRQQLEQHSGRYRELFREAVRIIAVSEEMVRRLADLGAPKNKLVHLPAFVNLGLFPYADRSGFPPKFIAVGRFAESKSPHLTLLAFQKVAQRVPEATLTLVGKGGGGELFEACMILARALGIGHRVFFKGVMTHAETAREMQQARIFVQHSVTTPEQGDREGKPVAIMEAMASGLPVVSTRHSGITELIRDGETGLLTAEYDIDAMAGSMLRLAGDDGLVHRLGRCASEYIHRHPLVSRHIELLETLIDECIEG